MLRCPLSGCGWHAVAPTPSAGLERLEEHVLAEHVDVESADLPADTVEIKREGDDEWTRVSVEDALED